ncbi:uncharacterized protein METZ01_LOCUS152070 [marine metagenome]|uniref:Uncharacterized protein n=1 Tax=marine metagenome TaxID=408172 RepID=A0A382ACE5_9ZZZZ
MVEVDKKHRIHGNSSNSDAKVVPSCL